MDLAILRFFAAPFVASLVLSGIHAYLGVHVVERGVIFVDLSLAQIAALGAIIAVLLPFGGGDPHGVFAYWTSLAFTLIGAAVFSTIRTRRARIPQEAIIGICYAVASAASILAIAVATGRVLGIRRVPAVLGQGMPGYDPRSLKGNGVTYATSPQGADHTAGNAFGARNQVNPLAVSGQRELSLKLQIIAAMLDSTGLCFFARPPIIADPQLMVDMLNGRFGWGWTKEDFDRANRDVLRTEIEFNRRAGLTAADYRIPEYMREEPLAPHNETFDIPDSDLDTVFEAL